LSGNAALLPLDCQAVQQFNNSTIQPFSSLDFVPGILEYSMRRQSQFVE